MKRLEDYTRFSQMVELSSRWFDGLMLPLASAIVSALGVLLVIDGKVVGWAIAILAAALMVVLLQLRQQKHSSLILTKGGFTIKSDQGVSSYRWREVQSFEVKRSALEERVTFTLVRGAQCRNGTTSLSGLDFPATPCGSVRVMPDDYGIGNTQLQAVLSTWMKQFS